MRWIQDAWTHDSLHGDGPQHCRSPECSTLEHDHRPSETTESTALLPVPVDRHWQKQNNNQSDELGGPYHTYIQDVSLP
jgi:hypothetical protein